MRKLAPDFGKEVPFRNKTYMPIAIGSHELNIFNIIDILILNVKIKIKGTF